MKRQFHKAALALAVLTLAVGCERGDTTAQSSPDTSRSAATSSTQQDASQQNAQIATYVQAKYQSDAAVAASDVDVTAQDGVVTLRGTVNSDAARDKAESLARQTEGVRSVDNQLTVDTRVNPAEAITSSRPVETGTATTRDAQNRERLPAWITTKIQSQYFVDDEVKPWNIDVTTRSDGSVSLRGEVDDQAAREAAERIARTTEGVTRVDNKLRIQNDTTRADNRDTDTLEIDDAWLTAQIQAKYFLDDDVKGRQINVDTREGSVTLRGEVESPAERRQAVAIARNTEGVRSVDNQLQVRAAGADAGNANTADRAAQANTSSQPVEDGWITTKVQSQFYLDDDIKGRDIDVETQNGVVTLTGTVDTDAEKHTAEIIARETQGVARVVNELAVTARHQQ